MKVEDASSCPEEADPFPGFSLSDKDVIRHGTPFKENMGLKGPVKTTYNSLWNDVALPFVQGWNTLGVSKNANPVNTMPIIHSTAKGWLTVTDATACFNSIDTVSHINDNDSLENALSALKAQIPLEKKNGTIPRLQQAQFEI